MKKIDAILISIVVVICVIKFFTEYRDDSFLKQFRSEKIVVEGIVKEEPDDRGTGIRILLEVIRIGRFSNDSKNITYSLAPTRSSKILVTVRTSLKLLYGDRVRIDGMIDHPQVVVGNSGDVFDYPHYLGKDHIYYDDRHSEAYE